MAQWTLPAVLAVLGAGCSQIFGLASPTRVDGMGGDGIGAAGDRDGDTVADDRDNCPDAPNKDQVDTCPANVRERSGRDI